MLLVVEESVRAGLKEVVGSFLQEKAQLHRGKYDRFDREGSGRGHYE